MDRGLYTDSPSLHPKIFLSSWQLMAWLFFHPLAWKHYLAHLTPPLSPDFALLELNSWHWRQRTIRELLIRVYGVIPLSLLIGLIVLFALAGMPFVSNVALALLLCTLMWTTTFLLGLVVGVAPGIAVGSLIAISGGLVASFVWDLGLQVTTLYVMGAVFRGFCGGLIGAFCLAIGQESGLRPRRQALGGILLGLFIGGIIVTAAAGLGTLIAGSIRIYQVSYVAIHSATMALGVGLAAGLRVGQWRRYLPIALFTGLLIGVVFSLSGDDKAVSASQEALPGARGLLLFLMAGIGYGIVHSAAYTSQFIIPYTFARHIGGVWAGALAGTFTAATTFLIFGSIEGTESFWPELLWIWVASAIGLTLNYWLPFLLFPFAAAWNQFLYQLQINRHQHSPAYLNYHSAFWNEHNTWPLWGLEDHLMLTLEHHPQEARKAMDYLLFTPQRWAVQETMIEQNARQLSNCRTIDDMSDIASRMVMPSIEITHTASQILIFFVKISREIDISRQQKNLYHQRIALKQIIEQLAGLIRDLSFSQHQYAFRFQPIAQQWHRQLLAHLFGLVQQAKQSQILENPYIFGVPLDHRNTLFIGRVDIATQIEQLLWDWRRPPLLLYGQRRMGKTSLLHNLQRLLPEKIIPLFVDGQAIAGANNYPDFLYGLATAMIRSAHYQRQLNIHPIERVRLQESPFIYFNEWLDIVERQMVVHNKNQALLMLDEFEALAGTLDKGRFDETDFMNLLRHLIQHRSFLKILLAGSHTLDEFQKWASYLINVQVVHLSYLKTEEARKLIEHPVDDFSLTYTEEALNHILYLTRKHPHLIQLLCYEIVNLKNNQSPDQRYQVCYADVEKATSFALHNGHFFFADIVQNQVTLEESNVLCWLAKRDHGMGGYSIPSKSIEKLIRRELIEINETGEYLFQVEMIRRWFAQMNDPIKTPVIS